MFNKELPLKTIKEPKFLIGERSAEVFTFIPEKGVEYVYKEISPRSIVLEDLGENTIHSGHTLEEKAASMKKFYELAKEYLEDKMAKTFYLISENNIGHPCIMIVQEKIKGKTFGELMKEKDGMYS